MIDYLSVIASVLLVMIVARLLIRERVDWKRITNGMKPFTDELNFIYNVPGWILFYYNLNASMQTLEEKRDRLQERLSDQKMWIEDQEFQTGRRRTREADDWLASAGIKCAEVQKLLQEMKRETCHLKFLYEVWSENLVKRLIQEMDDLHSSGVFEEALSPVRERAEFVTTQLVGDAAKENIKKIMTLLQNGVTNIGVYGIEGVGKTAVMMNIYNQLLRSYDHVYFIEVPKDHRECTLQGAIAKVLGIDLQEKDVPKRAALLLGALRQRNFVLILDDLREPLSEDKIGIPLGVGIGRMIITSRSLDVCRRSGCQEVVQMGLLSYDDGLNLFKQVQQAFKLKPPIENVAQRIVEQCRGLPLKIVDKATDLRGEADISIWENNLKEMLKGYL
ncbi:probable disease resistance protein At4g14610 isoform X2 [Chenopodium quinoa]|uniref:probable disease resistance protein At4g14610 isoform X2 n=1 Tax=Chenopodium quinoa TaxID=63459 RepID=UPI000B774120|nr:probable disease resistance protein At4g14610 isoform X2 [Chenopodium quinoa]